MTETPELDHGIHSPDAVAHGVGGTALSVEINPGLDRAAEVAALIDPEHTLPDVELVPNPTRLQTIARGSLTDMNYVISHQGVEIGKATLVTDKSVGERWFNGVEISGAPRGVGFGTAAYKSAIVGSMVDGVSFRTHGYSQSEDAKKVWENLERRGAARIVQPFSQNGDGKYSGYYVVDAAIV